MIGKGGLCHVAHASFCFKWVFKNSLVGLLPCFAEVIGGMCHVSADGMRDRTRQRKKGTTKEKKEKNEDNIVAV